MGICAGVSESGQGAAEAREPERRTAAMSDLAVQHTGGTAAACANAALPGGGADPGISLHRGSFLIYFQPTCNESGD